MAEAEISSISILDKWTPTLTLQGDAWAGKSVSPDAFNLGNQTYGPATTIKGLYYLAKKIALVAAALTIDFTALAGWGLQDDTLDATGLKILAMRFRGAAGSNGALTISEGAANPHELFGAANPIIYPATLILPWSFLFAETLDDIGAADCEIDLAGVGTDEFYFEFLLGSQ